jgi:hypothetical protein
MRFKSALLLVLACALVSVPATALAATCCDKPAMACAKADCDMPCCKDQHEMKLGAVGILLSMDQPLAAVTTPAKQLTDVWFHRPVTVGRHILRGHYVIEHDNDRMARGEPCTFIYAFEDRTKPVLTFHCTHLVRDPVKKNTVVLSSLGDGMQKMLEFQFEGETASHGVPAER